MTKSQIALPLPRSARSFQGIVKCKNDANSDDLSISTVATDSAVTSKEYKETTRFRRVKTRPNEQQVADPLINCNTKRDRRSSSEERDSPPTGACRFERISSFQGLKKKFEKISTLAIQKQIQLQPKKNLSPPSCELQPLRPDKRTVGQVDQELDTKWLQKKTLQLEVNNSRQPHFFNNKMNNNDLSTVVEGETEVKEFQVMTGSIATDLLQEEMYGDVTCKGNSGLTKNSYGFLDVLGKELEAASKKLPYGKDELIIFLGDELEASACGNPQSYEAIDLYTKWKNHGETKKYIEDDPVEEMLESIELGYEATLVGCGMAANNYGG